MSFAIWLCLCFIVHLSQSKISTSVVSRFHLSSKNEQFQHLVIDSSTGRLYAGATNSLYQLDDQGSLTSSERYQTGPDLDSPYCNYNGDCIFPSKRQPGINKTLTNNYNQILLIYPSWHALIACGTLRQGVCTLHHLDNITRTIPNTDRSVPVSANSMNATTISFIGPQQSLYVATTFTYDAYRDAHPALSTRSLSRDSLFQLIDPGDVTGQSGLMIRNEYRSDFRVFYVGGFHLGNHAYWLSVQRRSAIDSSSPYVTKVLRVCVDDIRYETYSELPLECLGADNSQYNIMKAFYMGRLGLSDELDGDGEYLVGVFTKSMDPWRFDPKQQFFHSAICAFSLKDIRAAFAYSAQRCNSGIGKWNLPHFGFDQKCYNITSQQHRRNQPSPSPDSCQPLRIGGDMPATSAALITYFGPLLTSITAEIVQDKTVLFAGTNQGRLKKISLQSIKTGREYSEIQLSSDTSSAVHLSNWTSAVVSYVNPDMVFDLSRRHLYVMTKNELLKVALDTCGSYETCDTCLASNDPYCGWCTLENRCSRHHDCPTSNIQYGFLPTTMDDSALKSVCLHLESLSPTNASLQSAQLEVMLTFNFLPPQVDHSAYRCLFDATPVSAEFLAPKTLKCHLPPHNDRPTRGDSHMDMIGVQLKLWSSASGTVFYQAPFTYYDCGAHKRCTSCISSKWPCHWCLIENKCTDTPDQCQGDTVTQRPPNRHPKHHLQKNTTLPSLQSLPNQCPHIDIDHLPEVLLPSGHPFSIRIPVANLGKLKENKQLGVLECVMIIEKREIRVRGWMADDGKTVTCDSHEYSYNGGSKSVLVDFSLQTSTGSIIDQMKVQIYKCESLGPDCTRCRNLDRRYHCGWCQNRCQHRKSCPASSPDDDLTCPAPTIKSISPMAGPVDGGTRLEIHGIDMGYRREDVDGRISIGGRVLCDLIEYTASERIVCITRAAHEFDGPVEIRLANNHQRVGRSEQSFRYVRPMIDGFYPHIGPRSGGTEVIISGNHLLDASHTQVYIGTLPCKVDRWKSTSERLVCKTSPSSEDRRTFRDLTVTFDRANRTLTGRFDYTSDPRVHNIQPLITFQTGGRQLIVRGKHFNSVQRPLMFFLDRQNGRLASENSICQVFNSTLMLCPSPALLPNRAYRRSIDDLESIQNDDQSINEPIDLSQYDRFGIGFIMDWVESLKRLDDFMITVVPDPIYHPFPAGRRQIDRGDSLILEGINLNLSSTDKDIRVSVGGELCKISLISSARLVCQPPYDDIDEQRSKLILEINTIDPEDVGPLVVVRVGYLEFVLGRLVYEDSDSASMLLGVNSTSKVWDTALIGALIGVCLSLSAAAIIAIVLWWRKKMWQTEKEYELVRHQMDCLESNVRQECKQAFQELQSDISDLVKSGIGSQGIPYHPTMIYAQKIIHRIDPITKSDIDWQEYDEIIGDSLTSFQEILQSSQFVSILIDILDREHTIGSNDRVHIAALITSSMATDLYSLTQLLMIRLKSSILEKNHGKFMGKSLDKVDHGSITDSLLINWMSLAGYDHLVESKEGNALFLIHRALKVQTEKGPIDAVTGQARFSLAEENLLKDQIDFETITLRIIPPSMDSSSTDTIPCRVLTCDTISQVKSKIVDILYKNTPFSSRPCLDDIELEWRSSHTRTGIFLQDDVFNGMGTVSCNDHWRQLNTLQHYGIQNNAVLAVFIKMRSNGPYADDSNTYMSISSSTYLLSGSSMSGTSSPNGQTNALSRVKRYSSASTQWPRPLEKPIGSIRYWHLIKPTSIDSGCGSRSVICGSVPEIYFTRLLSTKGTVQQFIDDFFGALFTNVDSSFPTPIKYLFDFLDDEITRLGLQDPLPIAQSWKTNLYFLKFWSHLIQNFDCLFDAERKPTLESCMGIIDQVLADVCTYPDERIGKDSPSNKLLFARDLSRYRHMLTRFLTDIQRLPRVDEVDMRSQMAHLSKVYGHDLHKTVAVQELFTYAVRYREQVLEALSLDPTNAHIKQRFEEISLWAGPGRQSVV